MNEASLKRIFATILLFVAVLVQAQYIPVNLNEKDIYDFLDEMTMEKIISVNAAIKPYSRKMVAAYLLQMDQSRTHLNTRQKKQLDWYLREFKTDLGFNKKQKGELNLLRPQQNTSFSLNPVGFYYGDSVSQLVIKPIWGVRYYSNANGSVFHRWGGAEAYAGYGKWGYYASLRDNHESQPIAKPEYLTTLTGGNYKKLDYSEMLGGVSYSNRHFTLGLIKDYYTVGTNHSGANIISNRAPSFVHLKLSLTPWKWLEFNYIHGWLISNVIDSARSYTQANGVRRDIMQNKFIASNLLTLKPWRTLHFSAGNSIIYSDNQINPGYLIPVMFYKSVDHSNNSTDGVGNNVGQNSSMFFDVSFYGIKHLQLYHSLFIDELKIARWGKPDEHNFYSQKSGFMLNNWPVRNLTVITEYTKTLPITYQHDIFTTTYQSNGYYLGHYMRDNADALMIEARYRPYKNLNLTGNFTHERKGEEYGYQRGDANLTKHPFMEEVKFKRTSYAVGADYEPWFGIHLFVNALISQTKGPDEAVYSAPFYRGNLFTVSGGFNVGF